MEGQRAAGVRRRGILWGVEGADHGRKLSGNDKAGNHVPGLGGLIFPVSALGEQSFPEGILEAAAGDAQKILFHYTRYCSEVADMDTEHYRVLFPGQVYNITFIDEWRYQNRT